MFPKRNEGIHPKSRCQLKLRAGMETAAPHSWLGLLLTRVAPLASWLREHTEGASNYTSVAQQGAKYTATINHSLGGQNHLLIPGERVCVWPQVSHS